MLAGGITAGFFKTLLLRHQARARDLADQFGICGRASVAHLRGAGGTGRIDG